MTRYLACGLPGGRVHRESGNNREFEIILRLLFLHLSLSAPKDSQKIFVDTLVVCNLSNELLCSDNVGSSYGYELRDNPPTMVALVSR